MRNGGGVSDNVELFTRVLQFGAWSPTFTTWGNTGSNNDLWDMPEPYQSAARLQMLWRTRLLPYRYSAAAAAHATGVCPIRPMYYGWPLQAAAYSSPGQFMLGNDLIVAPVTSPVSVSTQTIDVQVRGPHFCAFSVKRSHDPHAGIHVLLVGVAARRRSSVVQLLERVGDT
jgi:alpha-glucosidase (family GH31 glycosyl hydrolase)